MSFRPTPTSSSSDNTTAGPQQLAWYPRDVDDRFLFLIRDITLGFAIYGLVLGTVAALSSLKSLSELAKSSTVPPVKTNHPKDSWLVRKLKCKYAAPFVIFGNGSILVCRTVLWLLLYFDIGGGKLCDPIQRVLVSLYVLSLWTTYILFEIRRMATGVQKFKGMRCRITHAVRVGTMCVPLMALIGYINSSAMYVAHVQHCVLVLKPSASLAFGLADAFLSIGHTTVFIFAVHQKSNVKVSVIGSHRDILPSTPSPPHQYMRSSTVARLNRNPTVAKIRAISKRNLTLASISFSSTAITCIVAYWASLSPSTRLYFYLGHVAQLAGFVDVIVNLMAILVITSSWKPASLKKLSAKIASKAQHMNESEVSSLGGT